MISDMFCQVSIVPAGEVGVFETRDLGAQTRPFERGAFQALANMRFIVVLNGRTLSL